MKRINIYLTENEKNRLNEICKKYRVSISTIADKVCFYTYKALLEAKIETTLMEEYIKNPLNKKTSIKPKCFEMENILSRVIENKNLFATNCLKIYANKDIAKYIDDSNIVKQYHNNINKALLEAKEQFYNYNNFLRASMRSFKENKDYYRRKLEALG